MVSSSINGMGHAVAFANESHWKITKPMISSGDEVVAMGESSRRRKEARQRHVEKDPQQQKQKRQQKRQEEQRERNKTPTPIRRLGLYERAMQERELKEAKLQSIRKELMEEYTFTPKIPSSSTSSRTATTNASSSGGQSDSVFDRLYRHTGSVATPTPVQVRKQYPRDHTQMRPTRAGGSSPSSTTASGITKTSATSSRVDELYHSGVRRARSRPNSNREEKEVRERRREAKELRECTFRPQINWAKPEDTASKLSMAAKLYGHGRIGISPREHSKPKSIMAPVLRQRRTPPREILVAGSFIRLAVMDTPRKARASTNGTPWQSPVRRRHHYQELPIISDYTMVSPLRDPSVVEDSSSHVHHHSNLPRIPIYLTAETADDTGDNATRTDDTEYGSI